MEQGSSKLWIDCDGGVDDALGILLAVSDHSSQLLGVSCVFGNAVSPSICCSGSISGLDCQANEGAGNHHHTLSMGWSCLPSESAPSGPERVQVCLSSLPLHICREEGFRTLGFGSTVYTIDLYTPYIQGCKNWNLFVFSGSLRCRARWQINSEIKEW